jgi:hypothetical protein
MILDNQNNSYYSDESVSESSTESSIIVDSESSDTEDEKEHISYNL